MACQLLQKVLQAHGGLEQWNSFEAIRATIVRAGRYIAARETVLADRSEQS
jgi:hypothetical protein